MRHVGGIGRVGGNVLHRALGLLALLPVFVVVFGILGGLLAYAPNSEDPEAPSSLVTVMAMWSVDGEPLCRAFSYRDLLPRRDTLDLRFALAPDEIVACREAFAAYDSRNGWPLELMPGERNYSDYWFEVEEAEPLRLMVHRSSGDANWVQTRYSVRPDHSLFDIETESASAGQGLGVVLGGMAGVVAWLVWVVVVLLRRLIAGRRLATVSEGTTSDWRPGK